MVKCKFIRDRVNKCIYLKQNEYIKNILKRYDMSNCNPVSTPEDLTQNKINGPCENNELHIPYREAVGSIMYCMIFTRSALSNSFSKVSTHINDYNLGEFSKMLGKKILIPKILGKKILIPIMFGKKILISKMLGKKNFIFKNVRVRNLWI